MGQCLTNRQINSTNIQCRPGISVVMFFTGRGMPERIVCVDTIVLFYVAKSIVAFSRNDLEILLF
jgi:hypothetical protein